MGESADDKKVQKVERTREHAIKIQGSKRKLKKIPGQYKEIMTILVPKGKTQGFNQNIQLKPHRYSKSSLEVTGRSMAYTVQLTKRAAKGAILLPRAYRELLKQLIEELKKGVFPRDFDVKKLKGYENAYRVRLGSYRVVYVVDEENKVITLTYVGPRERAY